MELVGMRDDCLKREKTTTKVTEGGFQSKDKENKTDVSDRLIKPYIKDEKTNSVQRAVGHEG
jgi:hypothetical protein